MAKLENVKVIEATDGEITKVEHEGTMFNKAEGEPQAGDLVYATTRISDTKADSFYEVVEDKKDPFEGTAIIDESGDRCFTQFPGSVRFKKEAESRERSVNVGDKIRITDPHPLSTHRYRRGDVFTVKYYHPEDDVHYEHIYVEGVSVAILSDEFEVIEEEDKEEELIRHKGKTYRNLGADKDTQAGDLVRFYDSYFYESTIGGKLYEVVGRDRYYDESGDLLDVNGWEGYKTREVFRQVDDEDELRKQFSPGDKVRLLNGGGGFPLHGFKDGEEYEVVDVNYDHGEHSPVDSIELRGGALGGGHGYALPSQLELVMPSEKAGQADFEEGDRVVALPSADEEYFVTNSRMLLGEVVEVFRDIIEVKVLRHEKDYYEGDLYNVKKEHYRKATEDEISVHMGQEEEDSLKIGDKVRITDTASYILHRNQRTGTIIGYSAFDRGDFRVEIDNYGDSLGFFIEELTKLEEDDCKNREYQEGDVVRVTEDHADGSRNKAGDIGIIKNMVDAVTFEVLVEGRESGSGMWHGPKSVELVAKAEDRADLF